jgi:hypothetical protein
MTGLTLENKRLLIVAVALLVIVVFVFIYIIVHSQMKCGSSAIVDDFEDTPSELQECVFKNEHEDRLESTFPDISGNMWTTMQRYHIELFKKPKFEERLTSLKDAPEQHNTIEVRYPIRSIRIRTLPNDNWRFTQDFKVIIYLKHDPSYRVEFRVPKGVRGMDYKVHDTTSNSELLEWMARYEPKIVVFTTGQYKPIQDLYDESFFHRRLKHKPLPINYTKISKFGDHLWINRKEPNF